MTLGELIIETLFLSNTVTSQYSNEDIIRNLNYYYDEAVTEIWKADGSWKFDDHIDDLPIVIYPLVKGRRDYELPTDARRIEKVKISYNGNIETEIKPINIEDAKESNSQGQPNSYLLRGRAINLYPSSNKDVPGGLIVYLSRSVKKLKDLNDEPRIEREFHRYLSTGASYDWYFSKGNINKSRELERKLEKMKINIRDFYSKRNLDYKSKISPLLNNYK